MFYTKNLFPEGLPERSADLIRQLDKGLPEKSLTLEDDMQMPAAWMRAGKRELIRQLLETLENKEI